MEFRKKKPASLEKRVEVFQKQLEQIQN